MAQSFASLSIHLVFSTKKREPLIAPDWQPRLYSYCGGILRTTKSVLLAAGGVADHVHLLISLSREVAIAEAARLVKANSSKWIHETFPAMAHFAWQNGYGAFSVSHGNLDGLKGYIANQEAHHRERTFQDEFRDFLTKHGIEYDERYVWD